MNATEELKSEPEKRKQDLMNQHHLVECDNYPETVGQDSSEMNPLTALPQITTIVSERGLAMFDRITAEQDRMGGVPCIRGLRIPVATILGMIADGMSSAEVLEAYPDLEPDDIKQSLQFAAYLAKDREVVFADPA